MGDTRYVPWAEGGNRGTVSQVTVLGDWDEEIDPGQWWVVSQGSIGEGRKKGKKGKKRKQEKEGGTFRLQGKLFSRTREEAEAHLREALGAGDDGDNGNDERDEVGDKGEGGDKGGEVGGDKGGEKEGDTGVGKTGAGSKDEPRQPPTTHEG